MSPLTILLLSGLLAMVPIGLSFLKHKADLFSIASLFALGFTASYGGKAWLLARDPELFVTYPEHYVPDGDAFYIGLIVSWGGLLAFYLGYYVLHQLVPNPFPRVRPSERQFAALRKGSTLAVYLGVGSMAFLLVLLIPYLSFAGLLAVNLFRNAVMLSWETHPWLFHFPVYVPFFALTAIHATLITRLAKRARRDIILVSLLTIITLLILGSRAILLGFLFSLVLYRHQYVKPLNIRWQVGLLLLAALLGGYLGIVQKLGESGGMVAQTLPFPDNIFYRLSSSYEQFENLVHIIRIKPKFEWGTTFVEDWFITYIPRIVWPGKPTEFGFVRAQNVLFADYWEVGKTTTYPIGILAELYLNFGYLGILGGMAVLGALVRKIALRARDYRTFYPPVVIAWVVTFITPHRTFGTLFIPLGLYLLFVSLPLLLQTREAASDRSHAAMRQLENPA